MGDLIGDVLEGSIGWVDHQRKIAASRRAEIQRLTAEAASVQAEIDNLKGQLKDADRKIAQCTTALRKCEESSGGQRQ